MWFKVDDKLHDHEKVQTLLERGQGDAIALWTLAGSWCGDQRSDGRISGFVCGRWFPDWREKAAALVDVGLWEVDDSGGREVYDFNDWGDYNPTKAEQEADAAVARRKTQLHRDPQLVAAIRARDQDRCRYCGAGVDFQDRRSNMGGTYDHVDPDGPNNLGNVVVACRGCNSAKGHRTPDEWGYGLLRPGSMGPARRRTPASDSVLDTDQNEQGSHAGRDGSDIGSGRVGGRTVSRTRGRSGQTEPKTTRGEAR